MTMHLLTLPPLLASIVGHWLLCENGETQKERASLVNPFFYGVFCRPTFQSNGRPGFLPSSSAMATPTSRQQVNVTTSHTLSIDKVLAKNLLSSCIPHCIQNIFVETNRIDESKRTGKYEHLKAAESIVTKGLRLEDCPGPNLSFLVVSIIGTIAQSTRKG